MQLEWKPTPEGHLEAYGGKYYYRIWTYSNRLIMFLDIILKDKTGLDIGEDHIHQESYYPSSEDEAKAAAQDWENKHNTKELK
jgi:hypothetical protein